MADEGDSMQYSWDREMFVHNVRGIYTWGVTAAFERGGRTFQQVPHSITFAAFLFSADAPKAQFLFFKLRR